MRLSEYALLAFSSLFVIVDPIATIPAFIAMTTRNTPEEQLRMARLACLVAAGVLMLFAFAGKAIFKVLGITLPAFQIAGSVLLLRIALDMLYARRSPAQETSEETEAGASKEDIAITPLAVPMLAGPGAISTSLILLNQAKGMAQHAVLYASIATVFLSAYWTFWLAVRGARWLNPIALKIITRLMGLLLAAVAIQFSINALRQLGILPVES
jgi:MarC family membrane protein